MKKRVGIIRGGISPEYDISIKTGANVQRALYDAGIEAIDMLLDKKGVLHLKGIPADIDDISNEVDVVWNALHGEFGEDGQIQGVLDRYDIPYTGSSSEVSAKIFNKAKAKEIAQKNGLYTPEYMLIMPEDGQSVSELTSRIYNKMSPPWVIKPLLGSGSIDSYFAFTPLELSRYVDQSVSMNLPFIVEQYIQGREAAVGVVDNFRKEENYTLPVVEIHSPAKGLLERVCRIDENEEYAICGGTFSSEEKKALEDLARKLHKAFGAKDYSQSEFIVDRRGRVWFIETDTQPYLTKNAPFIVGLDSVGASLSEFTKSILEDNEQRNGEN